MTFFFFSLLKIHWVVMALWLTLRSELAQGHISLHTEAPGSLGHVPVKDTWGDTQVIPTWYPRWNRSPLLMPLARRSYFIPPRCKGAGKCSSWWIIIFHQLLWRTCTELIVKPNQRRGHTHTQKKMLEAYQHLNFLSHTQKADGTSLVKWYIDRFREQDGLKKCECLDVPFTEVSSFTFTPQRTGPTLTSGLDNSGEALSVI